jgi:phage/plasmid-associated DNA primase|tara:strand:- start:98 stop:2449 length:2352 start_codon:yes stop_codon:yes gene_type:complete
MYDFKNDFIIHSFKLIDIELINGEWKKKPKGIRPEWNSITENHIKKGDKAFGLLTGKKSNILVLDFDDKSLYNEYCMKYPLILDAPRVATRKGFHCYFKWNDKYTELPSKVGKLDIQGNGKQVFYDGTEYTTETGEIFKYKWINDNDIIDLPNELFDCLKVEGKVSKKVKSSATTGNFIIECNDKLWKDIIENISIKYIDEYISWFQIVCGMYSLGKENDNLDHYKEVARSLSMKSKKYDKTHKEFEIMWENCCKYTYTAGSIRHYSRESNDKNYLEICKKNTAKEKDFYCFDEKLICDYFIESFGDNLICNFNRIYIYYNNRWNEDNKGIIIQKFLKQEVSNLYKRIIDNLNKLLQTADSDCETITKNIKECSKVLTNYGNQKNKNIWGLIYSELITRNIDNELFDTQKNIFVFTNKAYNLDTNKWFYINKFDYILTTCGKDYIEPTKDQVDKIDKIFCDIFPNEDYRKSYISILKTGLSGNRIEKFIVATGGGRNGKGVINDFYQHLLGDYYGILHLSLLTKEFKSGANTELRNIHKKRFLKATEPDSGSNEKLRMSNIKALTGESNLKARGLYENNFDIQIDATQILECNKLPFITMDGNEAEKQRMVIIPFETTFTEDKEDIKNDPKKYKPQDATLKTNQFKDEYISALFKYIIDKYDGLNIYIPEACKNLALKWMLDKDDFVGWFMENYKEEPNGIVSVKDLYKDFKCSGFFMSLNKAQQRQNNEKNFKQTIQDKLKHLFIPVNTYINSVRITKDSIKGYVKKEEDMDSDSNDELLED